MSMRSLVKVALAGRRREVQAWHFAGVVGVHLAVVL